MDYDRVVPKLARSTDARILFLVLDGLGGLPHPDTGRTELETARVPNLDALARSSSCGLHDPVLPGITPGSGPGHLGLFGYDPLDVQVGRGVLAAYGIGFDLEPGDVAARVNFCTLDEGGRVTDRRAGRISTETNAALVAVLGSVQLPGVEVFVRTVKEHRAVLVLRGKDLDGAVADTDPQRIGVPPEEARPLSPRAEHTAQLVNQFVADAGSLLAAHYPANGILLRGFDSRAELPGFRRKYGLRAVAIAAYPMYQGLARMVGMDVAKSGDTISQQLDTLEDLHEDYDFFFLHYKAPDSRGEDGDFEGKVRALETIDEEIPRVTRIGFDVVVITGDHSTPATLGSHSWHPVPFMIHSKWSLAGSTDVFTEKAVSTGIEGRIPGRCLVPLSLAYARRLEKYGA